MAGLSAFVALVVAGTAWVVLVDGTYVASPPDDEPAGVDPVAAGRVLADLEQAVRDRDPADVAALAAPDGTAATDLLGQVVANAEALDVSDFSLRYIDADGGPDPEGRWTASVAVTWRFRGFDRATAATEVRFGFDGDGRSDGDGARIASIGGGDHRTPLWLAGPVTVRRTPEVLVLAAGGAADARRFERLAGDAVPVVREVLPRWRDPFVVEVPATAAGLDRTLGADPGTYARIAAVTTTVDGSTTGGAPVHVLANPEEFGRLGGVGAQVVMSHEVTHLATDAATSTMPLWLMEGFADYVALRDVDLPVGRAAAQVLERVRADGAPEALPGPAEFDVAGPHLGAVYEGAWLACTVLVERGGEDALVDLYRAVGRGRPLDAALDRHFGWSEEDLVSAWRDRLTDLAA